MSHQATTWVMEFSESRLADRLVLGAIAHRISNDSGEAWPSIATVAREANVSKRSVQYSIRKLQKLGELEISGTDARTGTNTYRMPKFLAWVQSLHPPGVQSTTEGVQSTTKRGAKFAPEPKGTISKATITRTTGARAPEGFLLFMENYPTDHHGIKAEAFHAWVEIPSADMHMGEILGGLESWKASERWSDEGGRYIPSAQRFLRAKQWRINPPDVRQASDSQKRVDAVNRFADMEKKLGIR